jgi:uncharacterized protein with beta-barrel porin domain
MPNDRVIETVYIGPFTNVEAVNVATLFHPGELGARVALTQVGIASKEYQLVQLDSGTAVATPAIGDLVYWKQIGSGGASGKSQYLVTRDSAQAVGGAGNANSAFRNEVAGVLVNATTPGNFTFIQQKGNHTAVKFKSGAAVTGYSLVADTTTAQADLIASGTAITLMTLGRSNTNSAGVSITSINADLDIPGIP